MSLVLFINMPITLHRPNNSTPYRETVDGTRILLAAMPTLKLFLYIIPVPVLGFGRKPSPLGLGRGDCDRAVTGVGKAEFGAELTAGGGMDTVCVPSGETIGPCERLAPVFRDNARSLSLSCTFRLYISI